MPFALEELVTDDIDTLHFAIGRRGANNTTAVAVVAKRLIESWLSTLKAAGLNPQALYADVALLPDNPGQTVLWIEDTRLSVRRGTAPAFTVEVTPIEEALSVAGVIHDAPADPQAQPPTLESALLFTTPEDWARVQHSFDALIERFESLKVQLLPEGPLVWLARELPHAPAINLLQGEYAPLDDYGSRWRRWRVAALLAVALLGAHLGVEFFSLHQSKKQSAELQANIEQVFASAMPGEKPVEPRRQMQSRLARIRGGGGGQDQFLRALQSLSGAVAGHPNTAVDALSYRDSMLDLKITAPSVDDLAQFSQLVAKDGLSADLQSSNPVSAGVEGRLQIRATKAGRP